MPAAPDHGCCFAGLKLRSPLILLSGTAGDGSELAALTDLAPYGALIRKTITLLPRRGNRPPRTAETPSGLVNSIGLENPGLEAFLEQPPQAADRAGLPALASIAGSAAEMAVMAAALDRAGVPGIELNLSCPNVTEELRHREPSAVARIIEKTRAATGRPLIAKLPPDFQRIGLLAQSAEKAGVDGLTVCNTFPALVFDTRCGRPRLGGVTGGLSGPAILPLALYMVFQVRQATTLPILGSGGVHDPDSARSMLLAGANAIGLGTALFSRPGVGAEILAALGAAGGAP